MVEAAPPGIELSQPANASDANSVIGYNGDQQSAAPNTAATTTSSNGEPIVDIFIPRRGGGSGREPGFQKYTNRINDRAQTYSVLKTIPRRAMIKEYIIKPFLNEGRKIFRWCKKSDQWVCIKDNKDEELIDKLTEAIVQKMSDYLTNCRKRKKREQAKRAREGSNYTPTVCILVAQKPNLRLDGKPMHYDIKFLGKILRRLKIFRNQRIEQDMLKRKQGANGEYDDSNKRSKTSQAPTKSRDEKNQTVNATETTTNMDEEFFVLSLQLDLSSLDRLFQSDQESSWKETSLLEFLEIDKESSWNEIFSFESEGNCDQQISLPTNGNEELDQCPLEDVSM